MRISLHWKTTTLILICLACGNLLHAQSIEITIKDAKTEEAIPSVYVKAIRQSEKFETISNAEGNIILPVNCDSITLSHIAYDILSVDGKQSDLNTLRMIPKTTELAGVTVYSTDLKKEIENLLKNFSRFYAGDEHTYHCTYKETFKVDDSLARLLQFNMKWWDKDYKTNLEKPFETQNQIAIDAVSYSRARAGKAVYGGALSNKSLFAALHLNNYLTGLLWQAKDFVINAIEKTTTSTKISFDASMERNGNVIGNLKDSYFIFDNKTNALLELHTQLVYAEGQVQHVVSKKEKIPLTVTYKRETRTMTFIKEKNKLRLSYFEFIGEHEDQVNDNTYASENKLTIYITGADKGNTISPASKIPLADEPIYEQIHNTPIRDPSILLTSEEQKFISGNDNQ
jgi:hypothetical protein